MQYLLLIYANEALFEGQSAAERQSIFGEYMDLANNLRKTGQYVGGNRLDSVSKATTVQVRGGKRVTMDGPFTETKEQLGGYFLVEASDLDEAIRIAERIPAARWGSIEVRPIIPVPVPAHA